MQRQLCRAYKRRFKGSFLPIRKEQTEIADIVDKVNKNSPAEAGSKPPISFQNHAQPAHDRIRVKDLDFEEAIR